LLLEGGGDLALVGLDVDDEDEGVVLLDLLHGRLGVERVDKHLGGVHAGLMRDRLASVLSGTGEREGLGATKLLVYKIHSVWEWGLPVECGALPDGLLLVRIRLSSR
jgi:hypothetical protein